MAIFQDLRYAVHRLASNPGFTTVAVLTVALGVGATTAIFSVVNGVVLQPLPYPESDRLIEVRECNPDRGVRRFCVSPPNFRDWRERNRSFESLVAWDVRSFHLTGSDGPERLRGGVVSAGFFPLMRATSSTLLISFRPSKVAFSTLWGLLVPMHLVSMSETPRDSMTARTGPPAITPVPWEAGLSSTLPAPKWPVTGCGRVDL